MKSFLKPKESFNKVFLKVKPIRNVIDVVDNILEAKNMNQESETSHWEEEIDKFVYKLYDLTDEEIKIVEEG